MNKKLFISLAPLLATVAFVVMPAAAQAAPPPQWFENCGGAPVAACEVPEGTILPTISWGEITASAISGGPPVTCQEVLLGDIQNPVGDIAGIAQTETNSYYDCEMAGGSCGGGGFELATIGEHLPWPAKLFDGVGVNGVGPPVIRLESSEIQYTFGCAKAGPGPYPTKEQRQGKVGDVDDPEFFLAPVIECGGGTGKLTPYYFNGSSISAQSRIAFDTASGSLLCTVVGPTTYSGALQTMEFASSATLEAYNFT